MQYQSYRASQWTEKFVVTLIVDGEVLLSSSPFNDSALSLYHWSPIADELKTLDRKIVLNSMILKWDNIKKEFEELINF